MVSSMTTLDTVVRDYLNDIAFQSRWHTDFIEPRKKTITQYQHIVQRFINGNIGLVTLKDELKILHKQPWWGAKGPSFLMELNKLASNHLATNPEVETQFRTILTGLTLQNLGERIEQFYNLAEIEEERLTKAGFPNKKCVSPGNCAFIISLFALWLVHPQETYAYYRSLRLGLATLLNAKLFPPPTDISIDQSSGVIITNAADHQAIKQTLEQLSLITPHIKNGAYWQERFFQWFSEKLHQDPYYIKGTAVIIPSPEEDAGEDNNNDDIAEPDVTTPTIISSVIETFEDTWLQALPETALSQAIAEIQRRILVEESLIRRIYRALLNGHVIFTGPPGTGKTELTRLIPELLWKFSGPQHSGYATHLVTATSDWSTRTLISGIIPVVSNEKVTYRTQYGHLSQTILYNWSFSADPKKVTQKRVKPKSVSFAEAGNIQEFQGLWLVIDEFNRAPIDTALGEALTALSNSGDLQIPVDGSYQQLPLPKDFRIIGTLNSFDRNYLNQISEALKRRFSFIEVLPPSRALSEQEKNIVLYKALERCARFSSDISREENHNYNWSDILMVGPDEDSHYNAIWDNSQAATALNIVFEQVFWPLFETIRIYRQLGTAQAITLLSQLLTDGILHNYTELPQWLEALDDALCDTLADQLQVLLPDELDVLIWYLRLNANDFCTYYNRALSTLKPRRQLAHLEALSMLVDEQNTPYITDDEVEALIYDEEQELQIDQALLRKVFRLNRTSYKLPHFTRRLRAFKAERGL